MIDTDVYIPTGNGAEWFINHNQFYRQIRNFNIDLTFVPNVIQDGGQTYAATGLHWQVAQATSLQNLHFFAPVSTPDVPSAAVGIFMENVSIQFVIPSICFGLAT